MNERILYYWLAKEGHTGKLGLYTVLRDDRQNGTDRTHQRVQVGILDHDRLALPCRAAALRKQGDIILIGFYALHTLITECGKDLRIDVDPWGVPLQLFEHGGVRLHGLRL